MNLPLFIAKKVAFTSGKSFSGLIIRIAVIAVALSLTVMIVATAVISGFKNQIGEKIESETNQEKNTEKIKER